MPSWTAGLDVSSPRQVIVVHSSGTWFSLNGCVVNVRGNRARTLNGLCVYARIGEDNAAKYADLVRHVWNECVGNSFDVLKCNLMSNVCFLREAGLREAIRNHRGVGYYWSPEVSIDFEGEDNPFGNEPEVPPTVDERRKETEEENLRAYKNKWRKKLSEDLRGKVPKNLADTLAKPLMDNGFRDADIARIFDVSRVTVGYWRKNLNQ